MYYQMSNGKVIQMTIEQYLNLTDQDIQYLTSINFGEYANSPWVGSTLSRNKKNKEESEVDNRIDYTPEEEDLDHGGSLGLGEEISLDDCPDIPDESSLD